MPSAKHRTDNFNRTGMAAAECALKGIQPMENVPMSNATHNQHPGLFLYSRDGM